MVEMRDAPFRKFKLPTVRIVHVGDWDAVYVDGRLIHWHDRLRAGGLLDLLGVPNEADELDSLLDDPKDEKHFTSSDAMPSELVEFEKRVRELNREHRQKRLDDAKQIVKSIEGELFELDDA